MSNDNDGTSGAAETHAHVSCDVCQASSFSGKRYKCLICTDYDLCQKCYRSGYTSNDHKVDHPIQCLLTEADKAIYFGGGGARSIVSPSSFTCPLCGSLGFTEKELLEHVKKSHPTNNHSVSCPICLDPSKKESQLNEHLQSVHAPGAASARLASASGGGASSSSSRSADLLNSSSVYSLLRGIGRGRGARLRRQNADEFIRDAAAAAAADDPITELIMTLGSVGGRQNALGSLQNISRHLAASSYSSPISATAANRRRIWGQAVAAEEAQSSSSAAAATSTYSKVMTSTPIRASPKPEVREDHEANGKVNTFTELIYSDEQKEELKLEEEGKADFLHSLLVSFFNRSPPDDDDDSPNMTTPTQSVSSSGEGGG